MVEFILNNRTISTSLPSGSLLLDFVRYEKQLTGTKIGCREGDCGACTVLVGEFVEGKMRYRNVTSCLTPLGNVAGKHVVTIEGLNMKTLSPVQQVMVDEGGTQCGFCTVGFVVSLTGFCAENEEPTCERAIAAIDGNICRCTGYKSIERAANRLVSLLTDKSKDAAIDWLVEEAFLPKYFTSIPKRLQGLQKEVEVASENGSLHLGGGTDLYVQKHDALIDVEGVHLSQTDELKQIHDENETFRIGGAVTVTDFLEHAEIQRVFPDLTQHMKLVSSSPIRNIATLAGNFVNASPIGDMTAFFLALDAKLHLKSALGVEREVYLKDFYQGYKQLDKSPDEVIQSLSFRKPSKDGFRFNFEKVSKRIHLDIASVNTAIGLEMVGEVIVDVHASAGGVGPTPKYLEKTRAVMLGKTLSANLISDAQLAMQEEISPISDVRGSAEYKRLLLQQLFFAHFLTLFPESLTLEELV